MKFIIGLLCLFFLILFHELGHFFAAISCGIKVEAFSIGFGPILFHKKIKNTDFRLSLIPFGGYCALKGEKDFSKSFEAGLSYIDAPSDSMYGVSPIRRIITAFAGPFANFIFTFIAFSVISLIGYTYYTFSSKIILANEINSNISSPAADAGLKTGDIITSINNKEISDFSQIIQEISLRGEENVLIKVLRNGEIFETTVHTDLDKKKGTGRIGVAADTSTLERKYVEPLSFFYAVSKGIKETFSAIFVVIKGLSTLFKGVDFTSSVSGPARMADMIGTTAKESFEAGIKSGFVNLLSLTAYISISLFIMNLLPIPVLDGGLILFSFIEFVTGKKISPKILYYIQFIGIAFITVLFVIGLTGDVNYFISHIRK